MQNSVAVEREIKITYLHVHNHIGCNFYFWL